MEEDERVRHRAPGVDERVDEEDEAQGEEDEVADCCREAGQRSSRDVEEEGEEGNRTEESLAGISL